MAVDDGREDAGYVAVWLDLVQFAGLDERRDHDPVLRTSVVAREECVFALQRDGADCALNCAWYGHGASTFCKYGLEFISCAPLLQF